MNLLQRLRDQLNGLEEIIRIAEDSGMGVNVSLSSQVDGKLNDPKVQLFVPKALIGRPRRDTIPRPGEDRMSQQHEEYRQSLLRGGRGSQMITPRREEDVELDKETPEGTPPDATPDATPATPVDGDEPKDGDGDGKKGE